MENQKEPKESNETDIHNKIKLEWEAPEFIKYEKGRLWYVVAGIILAGLIGYAVYSNSLTMAVVFIMISAIYLLTHKAEPKKLKIQISEMGIQVDKEFYPYNMISAYWIAYRPPAIKTLYLRISSKSIKIIKIELDKQNPVKVRMLLAREIPEVEGKQERFIDSIIHMLKL